jgi:peptidoglycan LD-endopeptidase CwlK
MSRFKLSQKSLDKLEGVHEDLVEIVKLAITRSDVDFTVGEGLRTVERQKQLVKEGKSKTMLSRHLTGHAVDLWAIDPETKKISWEPKLYNFIADGMIEAAAILGIPLRWGGTFKGFADLVHFELPKSFEKYKGDKNV